MKNLSLRMNKPFGWRSLPNSQVHMRERHQEATLYGKTRSGMYSKNMRLSAKIPYAIPTKLGTFKVMGTTGEVPSEFKRKNVPIPYPAKWEKRYIVTGVKNKNSLSARKRIKHKLLTLNLKRFRIK